MPPPIFQNCINVIDGGFFIHRVVWPSNKTILAILQYYIQYAQQHFTTNSYVVFDGYPECTTSSTKSVERMRRQMKNVCREINFDYNTKICCPKEKFLCNEKINKNLFHYYL